MLFGTAITTRRVEGVDDAWQTPTRRHADTPIRFP
jgi:hypothetical protein